MKVHYLIIAIVLLGCSCEEKKVTGIVVLNHNETVLVHDTNNSSATETAVKQPKLLIQARILIAKNPLANHINNESSPEPHLLPIATSIKTTDNLCAHTMCPMIYCENSLPPIPSQGICCQRCVTNPKCNTTACPKYKCVTDLMPANLTAGECCDHCAPVSAKPTTTTKKPSATPKKSRSSSSSSEEEDRRSSSEQHDEKPCGYNIRPFHPKPNRSHSHLIRLLTEALAHFRHSHSRRRHDDSSESEEK